MFAEDQEAMRAFLADADSHRERFDRTQAIANAAWLLLQHTNSRVTTIRSADGDEFCRSCVALAAFPRKRGRSRYVLAGGAGGNVGSGG
jgi:hypothetical protein